MIREIKIRERRIFSKLCLRLKEAKKPRDIYFVRINDCLCLINVFNSFLFFIVPHQIEERNKIKENCEKKAIAILI